MRRGPCYLQLSLFCCWIRLPQVQVIRLISSPSTPLLLACPGRLMHASHPRYGMAGAGSLELRSRIPGRSQQPPACHVAACCVRTAAYFVRAQRHLRMRHLRFVAQAHHRGSMPEAAQDSQCCSACGVMCNRFRSGAAYSLVLGLVPLPPGCSWLCAESRSARKHSQFPG